MRSLNCITPGANVNANANAPRKSLWLVKGPLVVDPGLEF